MQNPDEAIEQYQLAKKDRTMNSEQEKLFDAIADWKSNDDWQFADKEAAWKFFFQAGAASRDAEIARLKAIPARYRRMAFNAQLQDEIAELVAALETVIANAPEPYCAITRAVDAQCRAALAKARKP